MHARVDNDSVNGLRVETTYPTKFRLHAHPEELNVDIHSCLEAQVNWYK